MYDKTNSLISVIVPIYNSESYLDECIDSILAQQGVNIELILIDDGSTDHSSERCKRVCSKHRNVFYFSKPNGGVSSARNYGLDRCTGSFVTFVDSDDKVPEGAFLTLFDAFDKDTDLVCCSVDNCDPTGSIVNTSFKCNSERIFSGLEAMSECLKADGSIGFTVYAKMFRLSLFNEGNRIRFPEGRLMEEAFVLPSIFSKCHQVIHTGKSGYLYLISRPGSYTTKPLCEDCFAVFETAARLKRELPILFPSLSIDAINSWDISNRINLYRTALREKKYIKQDVFHNIKDKFMKVIPYIFVSKEVPFKKKLLALDTLTKAFLIRDWLFDGDKS